MARKKVDKIKKLKEEKRTLEQELPKLLPLNHGEKERRFCQYSNRLVDIKKELKKLK